jgi:hypothetical protein
VLAPAQRARAAPTGSRAWARPARTPDNRHELRPRLLLPPLSILLAGRPILALVIFVIWVPAVIFSGGLTHPMFILLAWIIIYERRDERRQRRD